MNKEEQEQDQDESLEELAFYQDEPESDPMGIGHREALKRHHRQKRGLFILALFVVFFGVLSWMLKDEVLYFFHSSMAQDMGRAEELGLKKLENNDFVKISGIARDMCIRAEVFFTKYRFLYFLGSKMGSRIIIQTPVGKDSGCQGAEDASFSGRVVDLAQSDRYDAVLKYYREHFPSAPKDGPMYLLADGVLPGQAWYYPVALGLMLVLAVVNLWLLIRARKRG